MVSVVSSLKVLVSPVRVLTEICLCGRRRRTSSIRLHWGVDSLEDKALLVSLEGDNHSRAGLVEDLHLWLSSTSVLRLRWKVAFREDKALLVSLDTLR